MQTMVLPNTSNFNFKGLIIELKVLPFPYTFICISLVTGYGFEHIVFALYFNSECDAYFYQVLIVPLKHPLKFCNNYSNSLCCSYVGCWNLFFIALFKFTFSYLVSKIVHNCLVEVRMYYDSYNSSM